MSGTAHERNVATWLNDLAILISGSYSQAEQKAKVAALTAVMADAFPTSAAFTKESLYAVSRVAREMAFPELHKRLDAWWQANKTALPSLAGVPEGMPAADRAMVGFWREYVSGAKSLGPNLTLDTWLSMIRKPTPAAFGYLCRTDNTAAEIAVRHGWIRDRRAVPTEDDIERVHQTVLDAKAAMHSGSNTRDERASTIPPAAMGAVQAPRPAAAPPPPANAADAATGENRPSPVPAKTLAPEHLAAYRQAAGIKQPTTPPPSTAKPFAARPANDPHPPPPQPSTGGPFPWS